MYPPRQRHAQEELFTPELVTGLFLKYAPAKLNIVPGTYKEKIIHVPAGTPAQQEGGHTQAVEIFNCVDSETNEQVIGFTENIVAMWQATS